jgi:hypothetical protein
MAPDSASLPEKSGIEISAIRWQIRGAALTITATLREKAMQRDDKSALLPNWFGRFAIALVVVAPQASAQQGPVNVRSVFEVPSTEGILYRVNFSYSFPGRQTVNISDIGTVPASGNLGYLSRKREIQVLDARSNAILHRITLANPIRLMSERSLELPAPDAFPKSALFGRWRHSGSFSSNAVTVLGRHFELGFFPYELDGRNYIRTTYQPLRPLPERLQAEVAVLLSYAKETKRPLDFAVRVKSRERRSHGEWREILSDRTVEALAKFRAQLIASLETRP